MGATVYRAAWALPVASAALSDAALRVGADGRIESVGARGTVPSHGASVVELGESLILPGLVNVHAHPELTLLRGRLEDIAFAEWIERLIELKYGALSPEALRISTWLGVAEAIASGVTCLAAPDDAGHLLEAMAESGLRGRVYREVFGPAPDQAEDALSRLRSKIDEMRAPRNERVDVGVSPHAPYTISSQLFEKLVEYAAVEALPLCIHAAESEAEVAFIRDGRGPFAERLRARGIEVTQQGVSPIAWLERTGILEERPLLVHCVHVDSSDIERIARHGAKIAHCPISNAKFGHGVAPLPEFIEAGIAVGLGSDSVASNNRLDLLEEARFAALLQRSVRHEGSLLNREELLRLATLDGARALGLDHRVGSLEPGKAADFIAIRLDTPQATPTTDPLATLFHSARSSDVVLTVVNGRELYRNGEFLTLDFAALREAAGAQPGRRRRT